MLKAKKKITKRELKQDGLFSSVEQATSYYESNRKMIGYLGFGLVVIVLAVIVYMNNRSNNNEKAATELGKILAIYDAGANDPKQYQAAIDGVPATGIMGLRKIVDDYGNSASGQLARFYLANACFVLGKTDEALKEFNAFSSSDNLLESSALAGVAACYEAKGEYKEAARYYENAANVSSMPATQPDYLNASARCYMSAGDKENALRLYKRLKKEFPTTTFAREADRFIAQLSV